jgi:hypothetical protein
MRLGWACPNLFFYSRACTQGTHWHRNGGEEGIYKGHIEELLKGGQRLYKQLWEAKALESKQLRGTRLHGIYAGYTVVAINIQMANFGWAHPNRVVSQAVFQKCATGHPKFGAERKVRALPWGFALIASRLWTLRAFQKNRSFKKTSKKVGAGWRRGFRWYERACKRHEHTQAVGLGFGGWACIRLSERARLQPPADERACPMSSIRNLKLAKSMAVPNLSSDPSEVLIGQPIGRH